MGTLYDPGPGDSSRFWITRGPVPNPYLGPSIDFSIYLYSPGPGTSNFLSSEVFPDIL